MRMEIAPLRDGSVKELEPVFREEIETWSRQLSWDYRPAQTLIKTYLAVGSMPGFAVKNDQGAVVGYIYFVIDRPVAFIGGAYVLDRYSGLEPYSLLLNHCISFLTKLMTVDRIETQLFPFNFDSEPLLRAMQFSTLKRFFLTLELAGDVPTTTAATSGSTQSSPFRIVDWSQKLVKHSAGVIYDSHIATPDRFLCRDYQTEKGSFRLLSNLIDHPACGQFSPRETRLAVDSEDRLCGILVASRIKPDTGMVPQLSVRRDCQGKGLGSMLMRSYLQAAKKAGLRRTTLSVSEANTRALKLYSKLGFKPLKEFHAYVWER
jgi:ribosomal protein S18 acetylase RimI-like enzyme